MIKLLDLESGRPTGKYDMDGNELFEGDRVLSFNVMVEGETYPLSAPKVGVPGIIRRAHLDVINKTIWSVATDSGGCVSIDGHFGTDSKFGVRKIKA